MFKSFVKYCQLQEASASMSRLLSQAKSDDLLVVVSASRDSKPVVQYSKDNISKNHNVENRRKRRDQSYGSTHDMEQDIRLGWEARFGVNEKGIYKQDFSNKLGFKKTYGTYQEPGIKTRVLEDSIWIVHPKEGLEDISPQEIIKFFLDLANKYTQAGVIIRLPGESQAYEYFTKYSNEKPGSRRPYNDPKIETSPLYSTKLRKQRDDLHLTYQPDFDVSEHPSSWQDKENPNERLS